MNRKLFPFLAEVVYLDAASAMPKPPAVINAMTDFYTYYPVNPHSPDSRAGMKVMALVTAARQKVAQLVNALPSEVIFTAGSTDSLNRLALMVKPLLKPGDEILLSPHNHVANVLVWTEIAKENGVTIRFATDLVKAITAKTKLVAYAQINNTIAAPLNPAHLFQRAKEVGAIVVNDIAQAIVHGEGSLASADALVFSGNKLYGPTGIGALIIRTELLKKMRPVVFGGGIVTSLGLDLVPTFTNIPDCFEPGTPNTAGIIGLGAAVDFFQTEVTLAAHQRLAALAIKTFDALASVPGIKLYSQRGDLITLFNIGNASAHDVVSYLGAQKIIVRGGKHCVHFEHNSLARTYSSSVRVSLGHYNDEADIKALVNALQAGGDFLGFI